MANCLLNRSSRGQLHNSHLNGSEVLNPHSLQAQYAVGKTTRRTIKLMLVLNNRFSGTPLSQLLFKNQRFGWFVLYEYEQCMCAKHHLFVCIHQWMKYEINPYSCYIIIHKRHGALYTHPTLGWDIATATETGDVLRVRHMNSVRARGLKRLRESSSIVCLIKIPTNNLIYIYIYVYDRPSCIMWTQPFALYILTLYAKNSKKLKAIFFWIFRIFSNLRVQTLES